jgi:hypothetical protein
MEMKVSRLWSGDINVRQKKQGKKGAVDNAQELGRVSQNPVCLPLALSVLPWSQAVSDPLW